MRFDELLPLSTLLHLEQVSDVCIQAFYMLWKSKVFNNMKHGWFSMLVVFTSSIHDVRGCMIFENWYCFVFVCSYVFGLIWTIG